MVKEPQPGRVKTRLGRDIGQIGAAWWFRHQSTRLIRRLSNDPRWNTVLAVAPDIKATDSRVWPVHLQRWPQGPGDLGDRMRRIFCDFPKGPVAIVGADIPGIQSHHIARAFKKLGDHQAVFGPALDGGYWLVGLKRTKPTPLNLFHNVRWSSENTLADTVAGLKGHTVAMIETLRDIDTVQDLEATDLA
jgi:uncharacterized protein